MNNINTKTNIYYWLALCMFATTTVFAQLTPPPDSERPALPNVVPPSPTVASLMYFEEVPVDLYTGQPDISVPVYSKKLNGDLAISLGLKYSTLGVRISEHSGWVGTGWALDAGGTISRTIRGAADELNTTSIMGSYKTEGSLSNPLFWGYNSLSDEDKQEFIWNAGGTRHIKYDTQPDLYQFSMPGGTGRFIIVKDTLGNIQAKLLSMDQRMKISFTHTNNIMDTFTITDANGYKYEFGGSAATEYTKSTPFTTIVKQKSDGVAPEFGLPPYESKSAWHLTRITTSSGVSLVTFTYTDSNESYETRWSTTENQLISVNTEWVLPLLNSYNLGIFRPKYVNTKTFMEMKTKKLSEIVFNDQTKLKFTLAGHPEHGGASLQKIELLQGSDPAAKRTFSFKYTTSTPGRLFLTGFDIDAIQKYKFDYIDRNGLPNTLDTNANIDAWGYNNGDYRHNINYPFNHYDYEAIKKGLLSSITYPTGGTKDFFFGNNTFSYEGSNFIYNHDSNPVNGQTKLYSKLFNATQKQGVAGGTIVITHDQYIRVRLGSYTGSASAFHVELKSTTSTEIFRIIANEVELGLPTTRKISAGTYTVTVRPYVLDTEDPYLTANINIYIDYVERMQGVNYAKYSLGGGVRISSIEFNDTQDAAQPEKKRIVYDYNTYNYGGFPADYWESTGAIDSKVGKLLRTDLVTDHRYLYQEAEFSDMDLRTIPYKVISDQPTSQLTKGNYVGYKKVKVYEGYYITSTPPSSLFPPNGYTEYEYTTAQDFPSPTGTFYEPYAAQPNLDYKRGLLLRKTVYNKLGQKLEETINNLSDYTFIVDNNPWLSFEVSPTDCEWKQFYEKYDNYKIEDPEYPVSCLDLGDCFSDVYHNCGGGSPVMAPYSVLNTPLTAGRAELKKSTFKQYINGNEALAKETVTFYEYNPSNYQLKEQIIRMDGGYLVYNTKYEYPVGGYTTSYFNSDEHTDIAAMADLNIVNKPILITSYVNTIVTQRIINKYAKFGNLYQIKEVEALKGTSPIEDRIFYNKYDTVGNVLEASLVNGAPVTYLWGYGKTVPVAKLDGIYYDNIESTKRQNVENATTEATLKDALVALQEHYYSNNAVHVTTYAYDPVKAVVTETIDPKGDKMKYEYDDLGRLIRVRDSQGYILSENKYNFRPQF